MLAKEGDSLAVDQPVLSLQVNAMTRPFRILGVQQIAIGSADKSRLRTLWVDCLGLDDGSYSSERENVDEDILSRGRGAMRSRSI